MVEVFPYGKRLHCPAQKCAVSPAMYIFGGLSGNWHLLLLEEEEAESKSERIPSQYQE